MDLEILNHPWHSVHCLTEMKGVEIWKWQYTSQTTMSPKISKCRHAITFTLIQYPALSLSSASEPFQGFQAPAKFPSSHSLKIKALLVVGESWGLQQAMVGCCWRTTMRGRRRITGNHWQTCQPAGRQKGDPRSTVPCTEETSPFEMLQPAFYILYVYKIYVSLSFSIQQ